MRTDEISNSEDIIDSRDVIARIEELESDRQDLADEAALSTDPETHTEKEYEASQEALKEWDSEYGDELKALKALVSEAEGYADDWQHGEVLIRESYFTEYAKDLCEDIGDIPRDLPSYIEIDWEKTAENIKVDYTEVDFDGVTYLIR